MTVRVFFDTNILVYALGLPTGSRMDARNATAERLLSEGGQVSVQILNEFVDVAARKLNFTWVKIAELLRIIEALCGPALPLTAAAQRAAVQISSSHGYRVFDAMILASAREAGCATLYTEDLQHGQVIEGVRIVNPFL
jgi:predicted nucleic acid-binding protein